MSQADDRRESNQPPVAQSEADAENHEGIAAKPTENLGEPLSDARMEALAGELPESGGEAGTGPGSADAPAVPPPATNELPVPEGGLLSGIGGETAAEKAAEEEKLEEEEEPKEKKPGLLQRIGQTSPYTVMLAIAILAILVGSLCLWAEWKAYNYTTKKQDIRKLISAAPAATAAGVPTSSNFLIV